MGMVFETFFSGLALDPVHGATERRRRRPAA